jgi:hypothetical protein
MGVGEPDVDGALQILRHLVGLSSVLNPNNPHHSHPLVCPVLALYAALFTPDSRRDGIPCVDDALAILRRLVNLSSGFLEFWDERGVS